MAAKRAMAEKDRRDVSEDIFAVVVALRSRRSAVFEADVGLMYGIIVGADKKWSDGGN